MLNSIDLVVILIIGVSIVVGILRGATREVLGITGWIGAFAVVFYGLPLFRSLGRHYIHNPMIADAVVAGVLFIISLAVFILISRLISAGVKGSIFGGLDRSLGLVFGLVRGVLIVCLVYLTMSFFYAPKDIPQNIKQARFMPWIAQGAFELKRLIPKDYLPHDLKQKATINPLDAKDLLENSIPNLEETVKNLSTLKPTSPEKPSSQKDDEDGLGKLIEKSELH
jgi:membrane protein required for colicin V production